jgi:hypothetical protein
MLFTQNNAKVVCADFDYRSRDRQILLPMKRLAISPFPLSIR